MIAVDSSSWIAIFSERESSAAQSCIDHHVRLVTRDGDFGHFARLGGLRLAL